MLISLSIGAFVGARCTDTQTTDVVDRARLPHFEVPSTIAGEPNATFARIDSPPAQEDMPLLSGALTIAFQIRAFPARSPSA